MPKIQATHRAAPLHPATAAFVPPCTTDVGGRAASGACSREQRRSSCRSNFRSSYREVEQCRSSCWSNFRSSYRDRRWCGSPVNRLTEISVQRMGDTYTTRNPMSSSRSLGEWKYRYIVVERSLTKAQEPPRMERRSPEISTTLSAGLENLFKHHSQVLPDKSSTP